MAGKVSKASLVNAGLAAMERIGKPLSKLPSRGNAKLYKLSNGETVRVRTCNRHVLLDREPINLLGGRLASVRYAPIATKFRGAAK